jgi:homoserine O-acetyltransferase
MMAHITYVSPESLETRFDHRRDSSGDDQWRLEPDFEVEHYLQHQGETFLGRFDSLSYLYLTRLMDYFDPFADEPVAERLAGCPTRFQVTSFSSDWRFDTAQSVRLTEQLRAHGVNVDHAEIHSPYGHDSFLLDPSGYLGRVATFLTDGR